MIKKRTGTREWAEVNRNLFQGCRHMCRYCYAQQMALRFNRIKSRDEWRTMIPYTKVPKVKKEQGRIMFPTTHDIMPEHIDMTVAYLREVLEKGNDVLIVSKPHFECIKRICHELGGYKNQMTFRFTIGSMNNTVLKFWEPGAPDFQERLKSLEYAYGMGFKTSVSCEPYLDRYVENLVNMVMPFINDAVWIGKMNRIEQRVDTSGWTQDDFKFLDEVKQCQTDDTIMYLYEIFKNNQKVKWKDSCKQVLEVAIG